METETLTSCPICNSSDLTPVTNGRAPGSRCAACGQVFLNPRMTDDEAKAYYQGAYSDQIGRYHDGIDAVDLERQRMRAHTQLHHCWDYIEHARTMLEIGCSAGYLMDKLNINFDTECIGVEPDVRYHQIDPACNFRLYRDITEVPIRSFDLICMSHSLEHMQHPLEYLRGLGAYCHAKTRMMIEVPNYALTPLTLNDHHPFAFTADTLNGLLARVGFAPLLFVEHGLKWPPPLYLLGVYGRKE